MLYALYRLSTSLLKSFVESHAQKRLERHKEDPQRLKERYGIASQKRPQGPLIWFHAASMGEAQSILSLMDMLLKLHDRFEILVTTHTLGSAHLMAEKLPPRCRHQYVPFDVVDWVDRFLDHWKPNLALWVESEFWPNLLKRTKARGIPFLLLNGRLSDQSYKKWRFFKFVSADLLNSFNLCMAQSVLDQEKLEKLGARNVLCPGNLKYTSAPLLHKGEDAEALRTQIGSRPFWIAASTHPGEEEIILEAHRHLRKEFPSLLTILVPRHPLRAPEILSLLRRYFFSSAQRSKGHPIHPSTEIYLADTLGELGLFLYLGSIVFVGGSLVPKGGHNMIEPAQLQCALLHGPYMFKCKEIVETFHAHEAAIEVATSQELAIQVSRLLKDSLLRETYQKKAKEVVETQAKVMETVLHHLLPYLRNLAEYDRQRTSLLV